MAYQAGKQTTKRSKPSYAYAVISVTLVLFLLGLMGSIILYSDHISRMLKEQVVINMELKKDVSEVDVLQLQKKLDKEPFVKSSKFVSKEEAAAITMKDLGANIELLGYNPFFDKLEFNFVADSVNETFFKKFEAELEQNAIVADVYYDDATNKMEQKLKLVGYIVAGLGLLILLISLTLIDNTIKLSMYSNRFLIKSMQLVGATRWFIIKPFIMRSLFHGFVSGVIAVLGLIAVLYATMNYNASLMPESALAYFSIVFAAVIVLGMAISTLSTYRAVSKYLTLKLDELY